MNITEKLREHSKNTPDKVAITFPVKKRFSKEYDYQTISYRTLEEQTNRYCFGLNEIGIKKGTKVLLFVRPSLEFCVLAFALFRVGAIPILIDPAMGKSKLFEACSDATPEALIAIPKVHLARLVYPNFCRSSRIFLSTVSMPFLGVKGIYSLESSNGDEYPIVDCSNDDVAAIVFTSGGTGLPKGVEYKHSIFFHQIQLIQSMFDLHENDVDMPGFPLFILFTISLGMRSVIPDMDPTNPAKASGKKLTKIIQEQGITFASGSPAIWKNVAAHCFDNDIVLPHFKHLMMFGAPVPLALLEKYETIMPNGTTHTPYGATEALPIASITGKTLLEKYKHVVGQGTCVGKPVEGVDVKIIEITDTPIASLSEATELETYHIGEIIVSGSIVTANYHNMPDKTKNEKILDENNKLWHRMGDVGYLDEEGQLWFCGRKAHRVITETYTLYSVKLESLFNQHKDIARTALIGIGPKGKQIPAIVIERKDKRARISPSEKTKMINDLLELSKNHPQGQAIRHFYFKSDFPVDIRHNIKIDRLELAREFSQLEG